MQGRHQPVEALLAQGVVEPGGGVVRVEVSGDIVLPPGLAVPLLLVVGLAEVAADQGVAGIEGGGDLDFRPPCLQLTLPDQRQSQSETGKGLGGIKDNVQCTASRGRTTVIYCGAIPLSATIA